MQLQAGTLPPLILAIFVLLFSSCGVSSQRVTADSATLEPQPGSGSLVQHATGFDVRQGDGFWLLTVQRPWLGARFGLEYALLPRRETGSSEYADRPAAVPETATVIETPIRSIGTFSSSFITPIELLAVEDSWVAHDEPRRVYAEWARERVDAGLVARLGDRTNVDMERLLMLQPEIVMINEYEPDGPVFARLTAAGLPVLVNGDWLETSPLGRAEWIKVFGLLYGRWDRAQELFLEMKNAYRQLQLLAATVDERPSVVSNAPYGGVWSVPAGQSYSARLFDDAGGEYLWADTSGTGALHLDLEQVFLRAHDADVWINPGAWQTLGDAARQDPRLTAFDAYGSEKVFNFDRRTAAGGGNDFFESGPYQPHMVLADLIHIFHPRLLPEHELFYYRRIRQ